MGVEEIHSQSARTDTGVILRSIDRETLRAEYLGRSMIIGVERGIGTYVVYLPRVPAWEDGEPITSEDLAVVTMAVTEILRHWGSGAEFVSLAV